jgi:Protein of unknown function (DUF3987)
MRFNYQWVEQARLWAAIVNDPSTIKTPLIRACTALIDKLSIAAREKHREEMTLYEEELAKAKRDKTEIGALHY